MPAQQVAGTLGEGRSGEGDGRQDRLLVSQAQLEVVSDKPGFPICCKSPCFQVFYKAFYIETMETSMISMKSVALSTKIANFLCVSCDRAAWQDI